MDGGCRGQRRHHVTVAAGGCERPTAVPRSLPMQIVMDRSRRRRMVVSVGGRGDRHLLQLNMTNSLDLEHLRTLVAIAECGGFSKAAAVRHISQPALSQHVRLLERGLKRKLFEKDGRIMRFTPDGERVLAEARQILDVHDQLAAPPRGRPRAHRSSSAPPSTPPSRCSPRCCARCATRSPDCTTRFEIGRSTQLADAVGKGSVDLAFVLDPRGQGRARGRAAAAALVRRARLDPADRTAGPGRWSPSRSRAPCASGPWRRSAADGHRVDVTAQSTTLEGVLAGVRAGLGVALLPSTGGRPRGLVGRDDLPDVGATALKLRRPPRPRPRGRGDRAGRGRAVLRSTRTSSWSARAPRSV